jgi:HJR/Mrr/RecB family endonuclease
MFEKVSFQLQTDGQWRLTGYSPRQSQDTGADISQAHKP